MARKQQGGSVAKAIVYGGLTAASLDLLSADLIYRVDMITVMHYIVVPYSHAGQPIPHWPLKTRGMEELVGHLFLVGLPIAGWARRLLGR